VGTIGRPCSSTRPSSASAAAQYLTCQGRSAPTASLVPPSRLKYGGGAGVRASSARVRPDCNKTVRTGSKVADVARWLGGGRLRAAQCLTCQGRSAPTASRVPGVRTMVALVTSDCDRGPPWAPLAGHVRQLVRRQPARRRCISRTAPSAAAPKVYIIIYNSIFFQIFQAPPRSPPATQQVLGSRGAAARGGAAARRQRGGRRAAAPA